MRLTHLTTYTATAAAAVIIAPLVISAPASSASTDATGSAFALSATGPVTIPPVSEVPATSAKQPVRKSLAELPPNPLVGASALSAAAWAGHGRAGVADLRVRPAGLVARVVTAKCENDNGVVHLVEVTLQGRRLAVNPSPNSSIRVPLDAAGTASVTLNKQVRTPGGGLTVTAIELNLPLGPGKTETIDISSVTCGRSGTGESAPPAPSALPSPTSPTSPPGIAPAPTPVPGDLAVTG